MQQTNQSSKPAEKPKKPPDQVVAEGLDAIENLDLPNESAKSVKLSLVVINMRKEAKNRKDYVTSDKIRNELASLGVMLKDEKDGSMSYTLS